MCLMIEDIVLSKMLQAWIKQLPKVLQALADEFIEDE